MIAAVTVSPQGYIRLSKTHDVTCGSVFMPPAPPAWYARVQDKEWGVTIAYMEHNPGREEWVMFPPEFAAPEVVNAFKD